MKSITHVPSVLLLTASLGLTGCATAGAGSRQTNRAVGGALLGSLAGAGLGAVIGHQSGETGEGAAIGAAAGALGGYVLGNEQDKAGLQAQTDAALQTVNTVVVNVKNTNGSITPVSLRRQGNLYVGPKGEIYTGVPSEDQLRPIYGF